MRAIKNSFDNFLTVRPALQAIAYSVGGWTAQLKRGDTPGSLSHPEGKVLFILGAGRSGNTLLRRLLIERSQIFIPPETYALTGIAATLLRNKHMNWSAQVDLALGALEFQPEFVTFGVASFSDFAIAAKQWDFRRRRAGTLVVELYRWLAVQRAVQTEWVGDKTPMNTLRLGLIDLLFPVARYVFIQRDPYDVVMSYIKSGIYSDPMKAADRWILSKRAWVAFRRGASATAALEVRYEDLVRCPDQVVARIMSAFGIPAREQWLDAARLLGDVTLREHHHRVLGDVSAASIGQGRTDLPANLRRLLARKLNSEAIDSGYMPI